MTRITAILLLLSAAFLVQAQNPVTYKPAVVKVLPAGATVIRSGNTDYYYSQGRYYVAQGRFYRYADVPAGITVSELPLHYRTIVAGPSTYYYASGIFYQKAGDEHTFVTTTSPEGAVVDTIPPGVKPVKIRNELYFPVHGTLYRQVKGGYSVAGPDTLAVKQALPGGKGAPKPGTIR